MNYQANAGIDARLKQHFGLAAADNEGLLQALGVDIVAKLLEVANALS